MAGDAADGAAAMRARAAEKHILEFRLDAPSALLLSRRRKRKTRRVLKDIAVVKPERLLDVDGTLAFNAGAAVTRHGEAIFERLRQPAIQALDKFLLGAGAHRLVIFREQTPGRIEAEQRHGVKTLLAQFRRENAVVRERVTIDLGRQLVRQASLQCLLVAHIHLLVTFIAVKRA